MSTLSEHEVSTNILICPTETTHCKVRETAIMCICKDIAGTNLPEYILGIFLRYSL
jgi:hypothetical protein